MASSKASVVSMPEGGRQSRRRARTRAELLAAAKRLFASKGFHGTKIADIAVAADVGTGTFYLHFPSKEALFADLVMETATRAKQEMDRAKAALTDPSEKARVALATFFRVADANRDVFMILFGHSAQFDALLREVHHLFVADIEANFAEGVAAGAFTALRPALVAQAVVGMLSQVVSWWCDHRDVAVEEIIDTTHALLYEGMARPREDSR